MSDFHSLHPRWITLQRIGGLVTLLFIGAPTLSGALILTFTSMLPGFWRLAPGIAWVALMLLLVWAGLIFPPIAYRHIRYKVTDLGVEIHQGVFWKHVINVPRSRVQHTDVRQGPLQRRYRVGTLVMHTAGTTSHTVTLGGLPHDRALSIRDFLLHELQGDEEERNSETDHSSDTPVDTRADGESRNETAAEIDGAEAAIASHPDHINPERRDNDA